jgi:hypothetical protein
MSTSPWIHPILLAASLGLAAQVPLDKDPKYRVMFEHSQFRILDVNIPAGETSHEHRHDWDIASISMSSGTAVRRLTAAGPPAAEAPRPIGHAALVAYTGKPATHRVENSGKSPYRLFAVENLRKNGWTTTPAVSARATTMTEESRAFRAYDIRLARETSQTSHRHAVTTVAVLVSGAVMSDGPDKQAKEYAPAAVGLKQLTEPGEWLLVPAGDTHHIVRIGPNDARLVEIEIR